MPALRSCDENRPLPAVPLPATETVPEQEAGGAVAGAGATVGVLEGAASSTSFGSIPSRRPVVSPLAPELYKIQFTASRETYLKFRQVQELLRHQIPDGDPSLIVDRALTLLLDHLTRQKLAAVQHPRKRSDGPGRKETVGAPTGTDHHKFTTSGKPVNQERVGSRHIPAEVKREVWKRDDGRCAFVGRGKRCSAGDKLEFHHVKPYARGGNATTTNIELRCRAHNAYESELCFGPGASQRRGTIAGDSPRNRLPNGPSP